MHISQEEIRHHIVRAGLGNPRRFQIISETRQQKIFQVEAGSSRHILSFHFLPVPDQRVEFLKAVSNDLFIEGFPIPRLTYCENFDDYLIMIHAALPGKTFTEYNHKSLYVAGTILGSLHGYTEDRYEDIDEPSIVEDLSHTWVHLRPIIPESFHSLEDDLIYISDQWPSDLPLSLIHGDISIKHILLEGPYITGLLNLHSMRVDAMAFDLATILGHCIFSQKSYEPFDLFESFLSQYERIRSIEPKEIENLDVLLKAKLLALTMKNLDESLEQVGQRDFYLEKASKHACKIHAI